MLPSVLTSLDLTSAIVRDPLVVSPNTAVVDAIAQMHNARSSVAADVQLSHCRARSSCVLVVDNHQVVGILTRQDVVRLSAQQQSLAQQVMRQIMTQPVVTLGESASGEMALNLLEQHQIHHLPILSEHNGLVGLVTRDRLLQSLSALELDQQVESLTQEIPHLQTEYRSTIEERTAVLQIREQFLQIVLDTLPLSVFWKDRNSVFVGCNCKFLSDAGLTSMADIQGKTDYDTPWGHTEADAYRADDQAVMETNTAKIGIIETHLQADGRQVWLEVNKLPLHNLKGGVVGVLGIYQDITPRIQAEQVMKQQLAAIEAAVDGIAVLRGETYLYANQAHLALFGYGCSEDLQNETWKSLYSPEVLQRFEREIFPVLTRERAWQGEVTATRKDGSTFAEGLSLTLTDDGLLICVCRDVSDRIRTEEQIRRYTAQLEASNRELESFSYSVSHDLRGPLRAIDGFSQALLEECEDRLNQDGKDYLDRIRKNVNRMGTLIDDLLRLSRVSRSEICYTTVNLSTLAQEVVHELQTLEPERQVNVVITPDVRVSADATLMRIVLMNLLQNAWKFTSRRPTALIEFGFSHSENQMIYFVRDNGAGFDMAYAKMLFGVFQRLHSTHEFPGTGIGLATVQRTIHRHGGTVWAEGAVEQGATVYFTVPHPPLNLGA